MTNAELIAALRYCPSHGCGRCVALGANGRCTAHGVVGLMNQAADIIEAQAKRIAELEAQLPKEGEWVWENYYWHCSACGENPTRGMGYVQGKNELFRVCPNCGARMKGEQE